MGSKTDHHLRALRLDLRAIGASLNDHLRVAHVEPRESLCDGWFELADRLRENERNLGTWTKSSPQS
jgi:hypothetical protein|tara:strand:- start:523 stop:723 length:201 start_codon:yes stop_codon:yes gene_type:complete